MINTAIRQRQISPEKIANLHIKQLQLTVDSLLTQFNQAHIVIASKASRQNNFTEYTLSIDTKHVHFLERSELKKYRIHFDIESGLLLENGKEISPTELHRLTKRIRMAFEDMNRNKSRLFGAST